MLTMSDRMEKFFSPCIRLKKVGKRYRVDRVDQWHLFSGMTGKGGSFHEDEYDTVLAQVSEWGYSLETIGD